MASFLFSNYLLQDDKILPMIDRLIGGKFDSITPPGTKLAKLRLEQITVIVRNFVINRTKENPIGDPTQEAIRLVANLGEYDMLDINPDSLDLDEEGNDNEQTDEAIDNIKEEITSI